MENGAVARARTVDLVINSHTLYQLSYDGKVYLPIVGVILKSCGKLRLQFAYFLFEGGDETGHVLHVFVVAVGRLRAFG